MKDEKSISERIRELLLRNLQEVFGEGDPSKRRSAIKELYTGDCLVYVPPAVLHGHEELDKFAGDMRATHPDFAYAPHNSPQALHNAGRVAWGSGPRGGVPGPTTWKWVSATSAAFQHAAALARAAVTHSRQ